MSDRRTYNPRRMRWERQEDAPTGLKAIETHYAGYRFRSRLEARWAVFFKTLGVAFEYEPEGYDLDGMWYLPDFFIRAWNVFVEIKPEDPTGDELEKCFRLADTTQKKCLILSGQPWPEEHRVTRIEWAPAGERYNRDYWQGEPPCSTYTQFCECRRCDGICLSDPETGWAELGYHTCGDNDRWPILQENGRVMRAYLAARQARFEHHNDVGI